MADNTYVVSLEVEVREVERDAVLLGSHDLPHAELVGRIQLGEGRRLQGAVRGVDVPAARV